MTGMQRAVVYDCEVERAAAVASMLRKLNYQPMVIDHAALVHTVIQAGSSGQVLLIGDVADEPDWQELCLALRSTLGDVPLIAYGSTTVMDTLNEKVGAARMLRLSFPFTPAKLVDALQQPIAALQNFERVKLPTGTSAVVKHINRLIQQVAKHDSSVLILGESGTGKELVARAIHDASPRCLRPFVAINCGAIPAELLESELFGHEKGAFTGAISARKGRFELAEGGTLFLDEIGDMSMTMQVKLLRVLQERAFERVGGHTTINCNLRIIAATHRNLEDAIVKGSFREDLFYRLNVFPIEMPALRQRVEDLPMLITALTRKNIASGRSAVRLTAAALEALKVYAWPGNVRELSNLLERLSILYPGQQVTIEDLPLRYRPEVAPSSVYESSTQALMMHTDDLSTTLHEIEDAILPDEQAVQGVAIAEPNPSVTALPAQGLDLRTHLYDIERALIQQAMDRAGGTVAQAARLLQLRRTTLVEKLRKFELATEQLVSDL